MLPNDRAASIEVWKQVIQVQMHFNEICLKIRAFGVAAIGAILAASGFPEETVTVYKMLGSDLSSSQVFLLGAMTIWLSCFLADRFWYHQLLLAAVKHGKELEGRLKDTVPEVSLTEAIAKEFPRKKSANWNSIFYFAIALALIGAFKVSDIDKSDTQLEVSTNVSTEA